MAEFPFLPLATDAYLGDTTHLTTIEHGAYLLLLMAAWRSPDCRLPDDDRLLSRYARLTAGQWARMRPILATFWRIEGGFWMQRRLTDEWEAVRQKREKAKDAAGSRWLKNKKGRHADASPKQSERNANHNHNHIVEDTSVSPTKSGHDFDRFWKAYPRRVGKEAARKAWAACIKRGVQPWHMIEGAQWLADHPPDDPQFIQHPSTWLNQGRYDDERTLNGNRPMARNGSPADRQYRPDPAWERFKQLGAEFAADPDGWGEEAIQGG